MAKVIRLILLFILFVTSQSGIAATTEFTVHQYDVNHFVLGEEIYNYDTTSNPRCCRTPSAVKAQDSSLLAFVSDFLVTKGGGQTFERVLSNAELKATQQTGLLRGGKQGENFFTNSASLDAKRAQQRLGLDGPLRDARIRFKITNDVGVTGPRSAAAGRTGTAGGGREFSTTGRTEIEILRIDPLRK